MAFPLVALGIGAIVGGALNLFSARSRNKAIASQARRGIARKDIEITQARIRAGLEQQSMSDVIRAGLGRLTLSLAEGTSGAESRASLAAAGSRDVAVADLELRQTEENLQFQKEDISQGARAQLVNPILAGVKGMISGAGTALSIYSSFKSLGGANNALTSSKEMGALLDNLDGIERFNAIAEQGSLYSSMYLGWNALGRSMTQLSLFGNQTRP